MPATVVSKFLSLPAEEAQRRRKEIVTLGLRIRSLKEKSLYDPNAWFFPLKDPFTWRTPSVEPCVFGFFGVAPIMIVGSRPSKHTDFNGEQCKVYYRMLHEHGLHDAHLTDCIKTDPNGTPDPQVQANIFAEELRIIEPLFVLAVNDAEAMVDGYLRQFGSSAYHTMPIPHWTRLRMPTKVEGWKRHLSARIDEMRVWGTVETEFDESAGRYRLPKPKIQPP